MKTYKITPDKSVYKGTQNASILIEANDLNEAKSKLRQKYHKVHFIIVRSKIFQILKDLDGYDLMIGGQITLSKITSNIPLKYQTYLEMRGKYHNKDKGLKYFIGLLYYFRFSFCVFFFFFALFS